MKCLILSVNLHFLFYIFKTSLIHFQVSWKDPILRMKTVSAMNGNLNLFWNLRLSDGIDGRTHFYPIYLVWFESCSLTLALLLNFRGNFRRKSSFNLFTKQTVWRKSSLLSCWQSDYLLVGNVPLLFWGLEQNDFIMAIWSSFSYVKRVFYLYFWGKFFEKLRYWPRSHLSFIGGLCWWWDIDWSIIMLEEKEWETCLQFIFLNASPSLFLGLPQITRRSLENGLQLKTKSMFLLKVNSMFQYSGTTETKHFWTSRELQCCKLPDNFKRLAWIQEQRNSIMFNTLYSQAVYYIVTLYTWEVHY